MTILPSANLLSSSLVSPFFKGDGLHALEGEGWRECAVVWGYRRSTMGTTHSTVEVLRRDKCDHVISR
jgi:hypothetical protein